MEKAIGWRVEAALSRKMGGVGVVVLRCSVESGKRSSNFLIVV